MSDLVRRLRVFAELDPDLTEALDRVEELEATLREAYQFISNGIEFGYICMPDADVPDPAHHTLRNIRAALGEKKDV